MSKEGHNRALRRETLAISQGYDPAFGHGAAKPPIFASSTFVYPTAQAGKDAHTAFFDGATPETGEATTYIYARLDHPNLAMVQSRMAALDQAEDAAVFNSGMAAVTATMLAFLRPGDTVLYSRPIYGGTDGLLNNHLRQFGILAFGFTDGQDEAVVMAAAEVALRAGPLGLIMVETPANPTGGLADIGLTVRIADAIRLRQGKRPVVVVDNTFLGPLQQSPLEQGADLCLTSLTKYAGGHSDLLAGCVSGRTELVGQLRKLRTTLGSHLDPYNCWLLLRSLETLPLRSERANANAARVASFLAGHPKVASVTYLGLLEEGQAGHALFKRQCAAAGSTFSFKIEGGEAEAFAFLDRLRVFRMAVSLGGTESLICHSASTTHYAVPRERREEVGVDESSLRISVGIEHIDDLIADLSEALEAIR